MNGVCASTGGSVVGVKQVPRSEVSAYGVLDPSGPIDDNGVVPVRDLVEKPAVEDAPSEYIIIASGKGHVVQLRVPGQELVLSALFDNDATVGHALAVARTYAQKMSDYLK